MRSTTKNKSNIILTRRRLLHGGVGLAGMAVAPALFAAEEAAVNLKFAAAPTGSTWYAYAGALRVAMLEVLAQGSRVDVLNTPMAIANTNILGDYKADLGLSFTPVINWAINGNPPFKRKITNLVGLVGGLDSYYQRITVQKDSPLVSLEQLKKEKFPLKIGTAGKGSLNEYMARLVLEAYGISYEDIEKWGGSVTFSDLGALRPLFQDKKIDAIFGITTQGHPNTAQLSAQPGQRFLELSPEAIAFLEGRGFVADTMPANLFDDQPDPVNGVGFSTVLCGTDKLSDTVAFQIVKGIMEQMEVIKKSFGSMSTWTVERSMNPKVIGVALARGADEYYKTIAE